MPRCEKRKVWSYHDIRLRPFKVLKSGVLGSRNVLPNDVHHFDSNLALYSQYERREKENKFFTHSLLEAFMGCFRVPIGLNSIVLS